MDRQDEQDKPAESLLQVKPTRGMIRYGIAGARQQGTADAKKPNPVHRCESRNKDLHDQFLGQTTPPNQAVTRKQASGTA